MRRSKHFLKEPGRWRAVGSYWLPDGTAVMAEGETVVEHAWSQWTIASRMTLATDPPTAIENTYAVTPIADDGFSADWASINPELGRLEGQFVLAGTTILSVFSSRDLAYRGSETLTPDGRGGWLARGTLIGPDGPVGAWALTLAPVS